MPTRMEYLRLVKSRAYWSRILERYCIDIRFEAVADVTPRTVEVSEAFGLGVDQKQEFVIFQDFNLEVKPTDVVYITGDSGSGKSVLLGRIVAFCQARKYIRISETIRDDLFFK